MINVEIANKNQSNRSVYYSAYGYIEVERKEIENIEKVMVAFTKKGGGMTGVIRKRDLTDKISINYKTFYGDREQFRFTVNINEKLGEIISKICKEESNLRKVKKFNYANQYRLFSSRGIIRELNPLLTYREEGINNDEVIVILDGLSLCFSEFNKGHLIHLEFKNKIAYKQGGDEPQLVLADKGFSLGKHYCEIILETEPYERSVIIGISLKRNDFHLSQTEMKGFYGYILSECKKVIQNASGKVEMLDYGELTKIGDRVGIMMEFTNQGLDLSFYVNKINLGVAFKSLPSLTYYPAVVLGFDGTRVRVTNNVEFPDV